jgi:membrane protein
MTGWLRRLTAFVLQEAHPTRLKRSLHLLLQIVYHVVRRSWEDRVILRAAALSFFTLLNLLPLACLILFILSHSLPFQSTMNSFEAALVEQLVTPAAQQVVMNLFDHLSKNLSLLGKGASGVVAVFTLLFLGTSLMTSVERTLNDIWRSPGGRGGFVARVSMLWMGVTLLPLLVGSSFVLTAHFKRGMPRFYLTLHYFVPFLITMTAFFALYWMPARLKMRFLAVLIASFVAASFFEGAKLGLTQYVQLVFSQSTVEKVYGSLALVPIVMVWIYYSWLIALAGAELAYVLQYLPKLQNEARLREALGLGFTPLSRSAAILLLLDAVDAFETTRGAVSPAELSARYQFHPDQTDRWFTALEEAGFLLRTPSGAFAPARPARSMRLRELCDVYDQKFNLAFSSASGGARRWVKAEEVAFLEELGDKTLAEWAAERPPQASAVQTLNCPS